MESIYDKLGDMLHSYLETGELPEQAKHRKKRNTGTEYLHTEDVSVIPPELITDFKTLGLLCGKDESVPDFKTVRTAYARKLKQLHPDTSQETENPSGSASCSIEAAMAAFARLKDWYTDSR